MTSVAIEIETFYLTRDGASFNTTKPFLKHYHFRAAMTLHFPVLFLLWLLLLGFQHLFLSQTDNDEPLRAWPLFPHTLSKGDVIMAVCTVQPLFYKVPILYSKPLGPAVLEFKYFGFLKIKITWCYHISHTTTNRICSGICLSNTKGKHVYSV